MQLFWQPQFLPPNPGVNKNNTINIIKILEYQKEIFDLEHTINIIKIIHSAPPPL